MISKALTRGVRQLAFTAFFLPLACAGSDLPPAGRCEVSEEALQGDDRVHLPGGSTSGMLLSRVLEGFTGSYSQDLEWFSEDETTPSATVLSLDLSPTGTGTMREYLPQDDARCAPPSLHFPADVQLSTSDGRLSEQLRVEVVVQESGAFSITHRAPVSEIEGTLGDYLDDTDPETELFFLFDWSGADLYGYIYSGPNLDGVGAAFAGVD